MMVANLYKKHLYTTTLSYHTYSKLRHTPYFLLYTCQIIKTSCLLILLSIFIMRHYFYTPNHFCSFQ